jgi:outer membrane lipoprotein-sorting protein
MACCCLWLSAQTQKKATEAEAKAMVAEINKTAASIRTLACNFTQVKTLSFLNDKMTSQGRMCYDASGKLRWEYTSPYTYTFILNGQQVHIQSAKNRQTIDIRQSRLFQGIAQVMMNSVTGRNLTSNKDFACTFFTQGDVWVADLVPQRKEMKQMFSTIRLRFDSKRRMVSQVEMNEKRGDVTIITLKDIKTNEAIHQNQFTLH